MGKLLANDRHRTRYSTKEILRDFHRELLSELSEYGQHYSEFERAQMRRLAQDASRFADVVSERK